MHVTSTSAKDLIEARMEKRIGFGSFSTTRRRSCSTTRRGNCPTTRRRSCSTSKIFEPTQPTPYPIRDRSERLDNTQDGRNTSRSQEINVNSFCEELSSSDRTGRLVESEVIQTRSSEDSKSLNVEQTHDRSGRPVATLNTVEAQDSFRVRSSHESDTFNIDDEELRERMENPLEIMSRVVNQ